MFKKDQYQQVLADLKALEKSASLVIKLLPVSKYTGVAEMAEALDAGVERLAESKIQDAERKFGELEILGYQSVDYEKHLIGHLQTNKVKKAVAIFDVIQSVDSLKVLREIQKWSEKLEQKIFYYLQVNIAEDPDKFGFGSKEILSLVGKLPQTEFCNCAGLMMIGKFGVDAIERQQEFQLMKSLFEEFKSLGGFDVEEPMLSMGMSADYLLAAKNGATMVRIGSLFFD